MTTLDSVVAPSWQTVILVCRDCGKRSKGPKGFTSKEAVAEAQSAVRAERPRPRVLRSSCLGLCPKQSMALARVGAAGGAQLVAAATLRNVRQFAASAVGASADTASASGAAAASANA